LKEAKSQGHVNALPQCGILAENSILLATDFGQQGMVFYHRRATQKGEASPALVPAERSHPTYTLFASCDNPPNIPGVRQIYENN